MSDFQFIQPENEIPTSPYIAALLETFADIVLTLFERKEKYTIYMAPIQSNFPVAGNQYLYAIVPEHLAILTEGTLSTLPWVNIQTRYNNNKPILKPQKWSAKLKTNLMFDMIEKQDAFSKYISKDKSMDLILMYDPKKSKNQYHSTVNMLFALSTFRCIITKK
jgi:hypothetical protein